jgi:hypothetical protein
MAVTCPLPPLGVYKPLIKTILAAAHSYMLGIYCMHTFPREYCLKLHRNNQQLVCYPSYHDQQKLNGHKLLQINDKYGDTQNSQAGGEINS